MGLRALTQRPTEPAQGFWAGRGLPGQARRRSWPRDAAGMGRKDVARAAGWNVECVLTAGSLCSFFQKSGADGKL